MLNGFRLAFFAGGVLLLAAFVEAQERRPDLDLTVAQPPAAEPDPPIPPGGVWLRQRVSSTDGHGPRLPPVAVRLVGVEPKDCTFGDALRYDVEVKNVTGGPLRLPISLDAKDQGPPDTQMFTEMSLSLNISRDGGIELRHAPHVMFGSALNPSTIRTLASGEAMLIRAPAVCTFATDINGHPIRSGLNSVDVAVRVSLMLTKSVSGPFVKSNPVRLSVLRP